MIIKRVVAKKIKNSRKEDSIKVVIVTDKSKGFASVPYDPEAKHANNQFSENIDGTIKTIHSFKDLINLEINSYEDLKKIEEILRKYDPTENWKTLGGNVLLALQLATLNALGNPWEVINKDSKKVPRPIGVCVEGNKQSLSENPPDFGEFVVLSLDCNDIDHAIYANQRVYNLMRKYIRKQDKKFNYEIGFNGGWATNLSNLEVLGLLSKISKFVSSEYDFNLEIGINLNADNLFDGKKYDYKNYSKEQKEKSLTKKEQIDFILNIIKQYDIKYLENPLESEDFKGYAELLKKAKNCLIVGNNLTSTNQARLEKAIKSNSINSVIVKPNQISSLIQLKKFLETAKASKVFPIISSSEQETLDTSISHLASGFEIPLLKTGIYGNEKTIKLDEIKKIRKQIKLKTYK